jgi:hypothetical protein
MFVPNLPFQLMPSPKWKLVVDIGNYEESAPVAVSSTTLNESILDHTADVKETQVENFVDTTPASVSIPVATGDGRDPRINEVVTLLGKFMPSDSHSSHAPYVSGFMSLRLLLLRPSRSTEEEELVSTMLDSFSSYHCGGRDSSDIAGMLARDFIFLSHQQQQNPFSMNQNILSSQGATAPSVSNSGLSLFGLPSIRANIRNSPTLSPIQALGSIDGLSIVSN